MLIGSFTMTQLHRKIFAPLCLLVSTFCQQAASSELPVLPDWQVLEYEEQAFWATAHSRLEIEANTSSEPPRWTFNILSSVVGNSEELRLVFDPISGGIKERDRLSKGKEQRLKTFSYGPDFVMRERREPNGAPAAPVTDWPVTNKQQIVYPAGVKERVLTNPHLLILLAQRLQAQGPGSSLDVAVHTDFNFYRVRLTCGNGIPVDVNYAIIGGKNVKGRRDTIAVALKATPLDTQDDIDDFSLLGLQGQIILFFDKASGLPVQVRGTAPRIGATDINLKSVTMRTTTAQ
jgi:hypothetical protein